MKIRRWIPRMLSVAVVVLALCGCGRRGETEKNGAAQGPAESGTRTFVMVPKGVHPYYEPCYEGFKDAAAKYGIEVEYMPPQEFKLEMQVRVIEDLISRGVDGIAISALDDEGLRVVIDQATQAGIKVLCFDAPAPSSKALCYIGTQNVAAGETAGRTMAGYLGKAGKVAVLQGGLAAPNLNQRFMGFRKALEEALPGVKIIGPEDTQGKWDVCVEKTNGLLSAHPDIAGIFGVSAYGAPGAAASVNNAGKAGGIVIGGFDDLPDTLDAIRKGHVSFCLAQKTYKMGWLSVEKLKQACEGREIEEKVIDTGLIVVTRDNVDTYMEDMKKEFN